VAETSGQESQRIAVTLSTELVGQIDRLKIELGLRSRGRVLEQLLEELLSMEADDACGDERNESAVEDLGSAAGVIDEQAAIVLVGRSAIKPSAPARESSDGPGERPLDDSGGQARSGGGIDLPGFVSRRSREMRRDLHANSGVAAAPLAPLPQISAADAQQALQEVSDHWRNLYGRDANATVVEAAMIWLARDIWPQCDQSDGKRFSWEASCRAMREVVPRWSDAPPSLERVIVSAGVLEDPFSASTLPLRIPTLIQRFMHRFRRRHQGTSFQTLEHTMTVQGALKQLNLPTDAGHAISLGQIREAYREMALNHHPDAGGSAEAMRRLNEAYQLLKELYRNRGSDRH
jgi:hypothetical protein